MPQKKKSRRPKNFFWRDKSGRGRTNNFTQTELLKIFSGELNDNGESIRQWTQWAQIGDTWTNNANEITRTV